MGIYETVKSHARQQNLTIAKLEQKANVSNGTIGKWRTARPYADTLRRVADVLGMTVNELQDEAAGMTPQRTRQGGNKQCRECDFRKQRTQQGPFRIECAVSWQGNG